MPTFQVNIELHHAHSTDYNMLYEQMEEVQGFYRTIKGRNSTKHYHLPHSEYRKEVSLLPATAKYTANEITMTHVSTLVDAAIKEVIAASKKNRKASHLTASYAINQLEGTTYFSNLIEAKSN